MIKRRYKVVYTMLRPFFRLFTRLSYHYTALPAPKLRKNQAAMILANHNGAMDPFFMALSFRRPIFFVASDHIFRLGIVSAAIRFLVAPIPIVKSQLDLRALRQIREIIQSGGLIGLFPEGNRSFSGQTMHIPPSTGKLIKQLKCTLILYRLDGGYLTTPRWAVNRRKGYMQGQVVRCVEPEELALMTADEVYQMICSALQVDPFEQQRRLQIPYRGRRLAETLELTLFVCPRCHGLATLASTDDRFHCACGLAVRYTVLGFFEPLDSWSVRQRSDGLFFDNVATWDKWQRSELPGLLFDARALDATGHTPLFVDREQKLVLTERASRSRIMAAGSLLLYADRLAFVADEGNADQKADRGFADQKADRGFDDKAGHEHGGKAAFSFPIASISRMIVHGPMTLQFTTRDDEVWEIRSQTRRSAYKYVLVFHLLQQQLKGEPYGFLGI
jgi:1-acyl-sn-glycerol-3-phosphate acyltransferase